MLGLFLFSTISLLPQLPVLVGQLKNITSLQGIVLLFFAMVFLKACHELGHAYACRYYGCKVSSFGIAIILLFPILYTDTKSAWKLTDSKKRLIIDCSGVISEINVVIWCLLWWQLVDSEITKQCLAYVITLGLLSSLLINANPLMRFDGYYAFSNFLEVDNLQQKSNELAIWQIRKLLLGIKIPKPYVLSNIKKNIVIIFAIATWIYRFFLYLGIAIVIYKFTFKLLGVLLFIVEIYLLIIKPVYKEIVFFSSTLWGESMNRNRYIFLSVILGIVAMLIIPWSTTLTVPAVMVFNQQQSIYTPDNGYITKLINKNSHVLNKQLITQLISPDLNFELKMAGQEVKYLKKKIAQDKKNNLISYEESDLFDLDKAINIYDNLSEQINQLEIYADIDGISKNYAMFLKKDNWSSKNDYLFKLINQQQWQIKAYLPEYELERVAYVKNPYFISDVPSQAVIRLTFLSKGLDSEKNLDEPYLSSQFSGPIATYEQRDETAKNFELIDSYYPLYFKVINKPNIRYEQRGVVVMEVQRKSILARLYQKAVSMLIKESSF